MSRQYTDKVPSEWTYREAHPNSPRASVRIEAPDPSIKNVQATWFTVGSMTKLLKKCGANGVTFLVPSYEQRPWSPPIGYECVYESYFQRDTKLWFLIPRLITS